MAFVTLLFAAGQIERIRQFNSPDRIASSVTNQLPCNLASTWHIVLITFTASLHFLRTATHELLNKIHDVLTPLIYFAFCKP